jgi:hypothetical protein
LPPVGPLARPTPKFCAAGAGGVTTVQACVGGGAPAAKPSATDSDLSKAHRCVGYSRPAAHLKSCSSLAAPASQLCRPFGELQRASRRRGHQPGHHDQVPAMHNEQRRGQRPGHHDQVPATDNGRYCRPRATVCAQRSSSCDAQRAAPRATVWQ